MPKDFGIYRSISKCNTQLFTVIFITFTPKIPTYTVVNNTFCRYIQIVHSKGIYIYILYMCVCVFLRGNR